jgi:hypothetical protein
MPRGEPARMGRKGRVSDYYHVRSARWRAKRRMAHALRTAVKLRARVRVKFVMRPGRGNGAELPDCSGCPLAIQIGGGF